MAWFALVERLWESAAFRPSLMGSVGTASEESHLRLPILLDHLAIDPGGYLLRIALPGLGPVSVCRIGHR